MIKISIIVPTYNEEKNIEKCLQSLCNQTINRNEYEIIVVDGNSKDNTISIAKQYADVVMIQKSEKVGGARNDGVLCSKSNIIATIDADCFAPPNWLEIILNNFKNHQIVQLYGTVTPIENSLKNQLCLMYMNTLSNILYHTKILYYTLGCNTAFDKKSFIDAGMYRTIDAGDDLEIATRMRKIGKVKLDNKMKVSFSMRRFQQFGMIKSVCEWLYIAVIKGGKSDKYSYSKRDYNLEK
ncbi:MAG: glycosyltransferase [Pedobacter sp.]|uniref:glycosyltransferase n=1 Tax=Pedobacter sp. TaxID=1411316 RepID=UPI003566C65F